MSRYGPWIVASELQRQAEGLLYRLCQLPGSPRVHRLRVKANLRVLRRQMRTWHEFQERAPNGRSATHAT